MNLYIRLTTLKDRIKLRLMLDEAADLRRDLLHCQRAADPVEAAGGLAQVRQRVDDVDRPE